MGIEELRARFAALARDARLFAKTIVNDLVTRDVALQLMRAASGVASNHRAAGRGRSHAEFTAKLGVALEEADEAQFWLEHLRDCELGDRSVVGTLLAEVTELVAILTASCKTARGR